MRALGCDMGDEAVGIVPISQNAAGLHRRHSTALYAETVLDDDVSGLHDFVDLGVVNRLGFWRFAAGEAHLEDEIIIPIVMHLCRTGLECFLRIAHIG